MRELKGGWEVGWEGRIVDSLCYGILESEMGSVQNVKYGAWETHWLRELCVGDGTSLRKSRVILHS